MNQPCTYAAWILLLSAVQKAIVVTDKKCFQICKIEQTYDEKVDIQTNGA